MERTKIPKLRNGSKGDSNPGSLNNCESDVLPLSYRRLVRSTKTNNQTSPTKNKEKKAKYCSRVTSPAGKELLEGTVEGRKGRRGSPRKMWLDNMKE